MLEEILTLQPHARPMRRLRSSRMRNAPLKLCARPSGRARAGDWRPREGGDGLRLARSEGLREVDSRGFVCEEEFRDNQ